MSIIGAKPAAVGGAETVGTVKRAIALTAVFIIVETVLVAETIWVILFNGIDVGNPCSAAIGILLSIALLANLGTVCGVAAARAAESARQSKYRLRGGRIDADSVELSGDISGGTSLPASEPVGRPGRRHTRWRVGEHSHWWGPQMGASHGDVSVPKADP